MRIISLEKKKEGIHLLGAFFFYAAESAESRFPQKSLKIRHDRNDMYAKM